MSENYQDKEEGVPQGRMVGIFRGPNGLGISFLDEAGDVQVEVDTNCLCALRPAVMAWVIEKQSAEQVEAMMVQGGATMCEMDEEDAD